MGWDRSAQAHVTHSGELGLPPPLARACAACGRGQPPGESALGGTEAALCLCERLRLPWRSPDGPAEAACVWYPARGRL